MEFLAGSPDDLPAIAIDIIHESAAYDTLLFYGKMGSGKTTLILEMLRQLGVANPMGSPTFSLVHTYPLPQGNELHHFDFYRIEDVGEIYDIGYEEYFYSQDRCFVEWPERMGDLLPPNAVKICIEVEENLRKIKVGLPD